MTMQDDGEWDWENDRPMAAGDAPAADGRPAAVDSNGTPLADGDSVVLIKDLKVKGAGQTLKRGTVVKNIRLTDNPEEFDCRTDGIKGLVLRCEFVRKR
jgi:protein PhnA